MAGQEWAHEIDRHIESAELILLLVSENFLSSQRFVDQDATAPQFEQVTTVVDEKLVRGQGLTAEAVYTVDVSRSDTGKTERGEVTVDFESYTGHWYVSGTTQIK